MCARLAWFPGASPPPTINVAASILYIVSGSHVFFRQWPLLRDDGAVMYDAVSSRVGHVTFSRPGGLTPPCEAPKSPTMSQPAESCILSEAFAGLQAQALGLAELVLNPELQVLSPRPPWKWLTASVWPAPLAAVPDAVRTPLPPLVIGCGGMAAAVGAALRRGDRSVVQV